MPIVGDDSSPSIAHVVPAKVVVKTQGSKNQRHLWYLMPLAAVTLLLGLLLHTLLHLLATPYAVGLIGVVLLVMTVAGFCVYARKRAKSHRLAAEKEALIGHLQHSKTEVEHLCTELQREVTQRNAAEQALRLHKGELEQLVQERTRDLQEANARLNQEIQLRKNISDALLKSQTRLAQAIEASSLGLWDWDLTNGHIYQSPFHEAFSDRELSSEAFIAHLKSIVHPQDYERTRQALAEYLRSQSSLYQVQYRVRDSARGWIWIEDCGKAVRLDKGNKVLRMLGTRRDISAEKRHNEQLQLAKSVFDYASEGILVLDEGFCVLSANPAWEAITGYPAQELTGKTLIDLSGIPKKQEVFAHIREALEKHHHWAGELLEQHHSGHYLPLWLQINAIRDERNEVHSYVGIVTDLTARKETDKKLQYLLNYDDLTGLANRTLFHDRLHHALSRAREENSGVTLIHINIDRFKQVNDTFGHKAADHLLTQVAHRLEQSAPFADTLARLGSDEFALILHDDKLRPVDHFAAELLRQLGIPFRLGQQELLISCSMGLARFPDHANDIQPLVYAAAIATKHARYLGGNNWQHYDRQMQQASVHRLTLENELRKALRNNELEVFFQPQADARTGRLVGAEALVRWRHSERDQIAPSEFVAIAEESGLIGEIGEFVLRRACEQTKQWLNAGLGPFTVAVNLSAHQLRHQTLIATVQNILRETQLPPAHLALELTESVMTENIARCTELLDQLGALGIKLAVDDFGTGYSSLSYLKAFPIDALKIDRSFVRDIPHNADDAAIARAIIALGKGLGLQLIAEGIETHAQRQFLMAHGCDILQGYLISKPLDAQEMEQLLMDRRPVFEPGGAEATP